MALGTLRAGDIALYNQQVLHCGSANESADRTRRVFYISVRNPAVAAIKASASIRTAFRNKMTLATLREELQRPGGSPLFKELDAIDMAEIDSTAPAAPA